ncbi:TPR repeat-containing protein (plasmid) [Nostoc sp. HK-01]|nr:TPR repeat-containing protein [Nostoc sp. HK-01]
MKSSKLAVTMIVLATLTFTPKAEAKSLFTNRQVIAQVPNSQTNQNRVNELNQLIQKSKDEEQLGLVTEALETLQKAIQISREIGDFDKEGTILNNMAVSYSILGKYATSIKFYQQALAIRKKNNDIFGEQLTLSNIGGLYTEIGQYNKALEFHQAALAINKQIGNRPTNTTTLADQVLTDIDDLRNSDYEAFILNNIGGTYQKLGQYDKALEFHEQALTKKGKGYEGEATTLNYIGGVYLKQGKYDKALEAYQRALAINKFLGNMEAGGTVLHNIGVVYSTQGKYDKALEFYQASLKLAKKIGDLPGEAVTLYSTGLVYRDLGQYPNAEKTLFSAMKIEESLRVGLIDPDKVSIFETQAATYRALQQVLIIQKKNIEALEVAERGRARALVDLLGLKISENTNNKQDIKPPSFEQIQQIAKAQNATLVEYSVNESNLYIWVIKPTGDFKFKQVALKSLKAPLAELVSKSRLAIGAGGRGIRVDPKEESNHKQNLQELHEILIEPIASVLPTNPEDKVIFIPHNSLFLVPFVALQDKDSKYLIEKHTILTAPAIQVLDLTRQQRQKVTVKDVLVMGNPIMPKVGIPPVQLAPLKGAATEALNIANLFKTKAITGKDATKAAFKQRLSTAKIIHLATHGLLDDADKSIPTAIALAPSGTDDGLLTPAEIIDLKINSELVVLSACDTGRGTITGDGVIGLSRALIIAGAPSMIVSLWSVPDSQTSELMIQFYQQWKKNPDKAVALRNAMLITMKKHPHPINWAAFILIGEAE